MAGEIPNDPYLHYCSLPRNWRYTTRNEYPSLAGYPRNQAGGFCRGREGIQPGLFLISPLGLSSPKGTAARRRVLSLWNAEVSQHPMRAGQDGISEPGDEGAVLALNLAA